MSPARDREAVEQAVARGSELLKQGKLDHAQRAFRAALEIEPENARVLALLGLAHFRANELAEARIVYEQLVASTPTDASHRLNLGLVYLKLNDADRAIAALEASRALDPSQGRAVSYLGLAYARAGRYGEAYRAFLLAGQNDLAIEIESNLSAAERDRIHSQIGRTPYPAEPAAASAAPSSTSAPRTKPPSAPPGRRSPSQELAAVAPSVAAAVAPSVAASAAAAVAPAVAPLAASASAPASSPEIMITQDAGGAVRLAAIDPGAPREALRTTESTQFVIPRADPVAPAAPGAPASMISRAVASATPSSAAGSPPVLGGAAPRPLSELATEGLVRPDDGSEPLELAAGGALILRVTDRILTRLDGIHVTGGDLVFERAMRRSRGHNTDEPFDHGGSQLHAVTGRGYLIAAPGAHAFTAVNLDDDILYVREDLVFAFEASLRWENGHVPGLRGKLPVVQFRGDGALALRLGRPLVRVKLAAQGVVFIDAERLAGWIGRVIPRAVVPPPGGPLGAMCVECTGEGIVLVEPAPEPARAAAAVVAPAPVAPRAAPPRPPAPEVAADREDPLGRLDDL